MKKLELFETMKKLVDEHVSYYKTDLDIDISIIQRDLDNDIYSDYIWLLRDSGTNLISVSAALYDPVAHFAAVTGCNEINALYTIEIYKDIRTGKLNYEIKESSKDIDEKTLRDLVNLYDVKLYDDNGYNYQSINNCAFESQETAKTVINNHIASNYSTKHGYYTVVPVYAGIGLQPFDGYLENY